jgi:hypothetical protein
LLWFFGLFSSDLGHRRSIASITSLTPTRRTNRNKTKRLDRRDGFVHSSDQNQSQLEVPRGYPQRGRHGFDGLSTGAYSLTQLPGRWLVQAWPSGSLAVHWLNAMVPVRLACSPGPSGVARHGVGNLDPAVSVLTRSLSSLAIVCGLNPRRLSRPPKLSAVPCPSFLPVYDFFRPGYL